MEHDRLHREKKKRQLSAQSQVPPIDPTASFTQSLLNSIQVGNITPNLGPHINYPQRTFKAIRLNMLLYRAEDYVKEKAKLEESAKTFMAELSRREDEGARSGLSRAREAGFSTVEDWVQDRTKQALMKFLGHDTLTLEDIPWRLLEKRRGDTLEVDNLRLAIEAESRPAHAKLLELHWEIVGEADRLQHGNEGRGLQVSEEGNNTEMVLGS